MMQLSQVSLSSKLSTEDTHLLRKQLQREIACLGMQLERLRSRDEFLDMITLQTYEEMIGTRKAMLESL